MYVSISYYQLLLIFFISNYDKLQTVTNKEEINIISCKASQIEDR